MISGHASIDTAMQATKLGAFDFLEKPIDLDRLLLVVGNALRQSRLEQENQRLLAEVEGGRFFLADSPAMKRLMADVTLVAPTEGRVLLTGENGSGKEEVARSSRASSSATRRAPSRAPCATRRASSARRTAAPCSSTRSATCR